MFCVTVLLRQEVDGDEVPIVSVLELCIILSQKDKVMYTNRLVGMPRDNNILRKPFMEDITIR
jgi:hypothetical protein